MISRTISDRRSVVALLAVGAIAAVVLALLPVRGLPPLGAQETPTACPVQAPSSDLADRDRIPAAHRQNVDCAVSFGIVEGFEDDHYHPRRAVRRDQMASFIARTLDAAGVELPSVTDNFFTDVTGGPHRDNINRLAEVGIVEGGPGELSATQFGPDRSTRRDQMASFIVRAAGYAFADDVDFFSDSTQRFSDVPSTNTHFEKVNFADQAGLAQGFGGGVFQPGEPTRRDQMASFAVRLLSYLAVPVSVDLDAPESATVNESVTARATVSDQYGRAFRGEDVAFRTEGTTMPETATVPSNDNGHADFSFSSATPQSVTVIAEIDGPGDTFPDHNFADATGDSAQAVVEFRATGGLLDGVVDLLPLSPGDRILVPSPDGLVPLPDGLPPDGLVPSPP